MRDRKEYKKKLKDARVSGVIIRHTLNSGFPAEYVIETADSYVLTSKKTKEGAETYCEERFIEWEHTCSILGCTCDLM